MSAHHVDKVAGVAAAGASSAPAPVYGEFLTTNGFWLLSYAEWLQVLGAVYVVCLLLRMSGIAGFIGRIFDQREFVPVENDEPR